MVFSFRVPFLGGIISFVSWSGFKDLLIGHRPPNNLNKDDFPHPFGPMMSI